MLNATVCPRNLTLSLSGPTQRERCGHLRMGRISLRALDTVRRIERAYAFDIDHEQVER